LGTELLILSDSPLDASTETGGGRWRVASSSAAEGSLHLVVVWSSSPGRVGEVAALSKAAILGRGPARAEDRTPRLRLVRQRPGVNQPTPMLDAARLSRSQLALTPDGNALAFERIGKCPVVHNGLPKDRGIAREGDIIALSDVLTFLVARRPKLLPEAWASAPYRATRFGLPDPFGMVGESPEAWELRATFAALARSSDPVLITGESGVGKELAASALHGLSDAAHGAFVARNAATLPPSLIDAELFGTQRNYPNPGAAERPGLIGEADGGSLFLDEIGELPAEQQAHLLRFMDNGEYQRLGDAKTRRAKVRLLAATNRDPSALKHDFLARFPKRVHIDGLDSRLADLPLLVSAIVRDAARGAPEYRRFLEVVTESDGAAVEWARVHPALMERLLRHDYELHFRELRRLVLLALEHSAGDYLAESPPLDKLLRAASADSEIDAAAIRAALSAWEGNVTMAAKALKLPSRYALYRLMKRLGVGADVGE
jgi:two-component system nitrogen regulation response regulator GlnG/two-component system response regulator HydG